jgi:hypothetical protein
MTPIRTRYSLVFSCQRDGRTDLFCVTRLYIGGYTAAGYPSQHAVPVTRGVRPTGRIPYRGFDNRLRQPWTPHAVDCWLGAADCMLRQWRVPFHQLHAVTQCGPIS